MAYDWKHILSFIAVGSFRFLTTNNPGRTKMELHKPKDLSYWAAKAVVLNICRTYPSDACFGWSLDSRHPSNPSFKRYQDHPATGKNASDSFHGQELFFFPDFGSNRQELFPVLPWYGQMGYSTINPSVMTVEHIQKDRKLPGLAPKLQLGYKAEGDAHMYCLTSEKSELLHKAIKKMTITNPTETTTDEMYVLAIIRPNIMTSEHYASTFVRNNDVSFTYENTDPSKHILLDNVNGWKNYFEQKHPGCTIGIEKGVNHNKEIISLRFVVMSADKKLIALWLFAGQSYSVHYKNYDDVKDLFEYLKTLHVPKRSTIYRCYSGGDKLVTSPITVDGSYQIHDEFYPMVEQFGGMNAVLDGFKKSTSNLMILAGQWGGGKSALFQADCYRDENETNKYYLIDDPEVYSSPGLFSSLIGKIQTNTREGITSYLFLEEADDYIRSKKNNPFLSRLAALTAGAAPLKLKIMVATNDSSESEIDSALTRGGRLYAMIKFGTLTPEQANASRAVLKLKPREFGKNVTLAEALTEAPIITSAGTTRSNRVSLGFAP